MFQHCLRMHVWLYIKLMTQMGDCVGILIEQESSIASVLETMPRRMLPIQYGHSCTL